MTWIFSIVNGCYFHIVKNIETLKFKDIIGNNVLIFLEFRRSNQNPPISLSYYIYLKNKFSFDKNWSFRIEFLSNKPL